MSAPREQLLLIKIQLYQRNGKYLEKEAKDYWLKQKIQVKLSTYKFKKQYFPNIYQLPLQ